MKEVMMVPTMRAFSSDSGLPVTSGPTANNEQDDRGGRCDDHGDPVDRLHGHALMGTTRRPLGHGCACRASTC